MEYFGPKLGQDLGNRGGNEERGLDSSGKIAPLFKFWATSVHTRPEYFSQRHKILSSTVQTKQHPLVMLRQK